ncbi:MAG: tRNA 2-thiouridine(34) synthase MnmA [Pseudomonadota bacterium]
MPTSTISDEILAGLAPRVADKPHVVVAISGGVDSAVACLVLKELGVRCSALFMKNWNEPDDSGQCRWEDDVHDALDVCDKLQIPLNTIDLSEAYWSEVFEDFVAEYRAGRTPNPDVLCNREIKFKAFLDEAKKLGGDLIATGHYARIAQQDDGHQMLKGQDDNKDQTYFLYTLGQAQLAASLFPVGEIEKSKVREIARQAGFENHNKKDSTGICFIGEQNFREFLKNYVAVEAGPVLTEDGRAIGEHDGVAFYTLGQRQGLGIGGVQGAREAPWFVIEKSIADNALVVAQEHEHPRLMSNWLTATQASWVAHAPPPAAGAGGLRCMAKTRYRQADQACQVEVREAGQIFVKFEQPQRAVTPGQSVVLYDGAQCLGGAVITETGMH